MLLRRSCATQRIQVWKERTDSMPQVQLRDIGNEGPQHVDTFTQIWSPRWYRWLWWLRWWLLTKIASKQSGFDGFVLNWDSSENFVIHFIVIDFFHSLSLSYFVRWKKPFPIWIAHQKTISHSNRCIYFCSFWWGQKTIRSAKFVTALDIVNNTHQLSNMKSK